MLGWWLLIATEGVYLGRRVVIWLYDIYANYYDDVKNYQSLYEHALLAEPIMDQVAPHQSPLILDVATGTGRLPLAMLNHSSFQGRVIGIDLSRRMLRNAAEKLNGYGDQATLIWCPAEKLPFADDTFDVVTSLESLEFMSSPKAVVTEMIRVLRPGGLLLMTNRIGTRLMPGKTWSKEQLTELLSTFDLDDAYVEAWQVDYHKVWAVKSGASQPAGKRPLGEILRCPCCDELMIERDGTWVCEKCKGRAAVGHDGVIELFPLQESC